MTFPVSIVHARVSVIRPVAGWSPHIDVVTVVCVRRTARCQQAGRRRRHRHVTRGGRRGLLPDDDVLTSLRRLPIGTLHAAARLSTVEVAACEIDDAGGVYRPVEASARMRATALHETFVDRKVMADAVSPSARRRAVVRVSVEDLAIDVGENQTFPVRRQDCFGDQGDVGRVRLTRRVVGRATPRIVAVRVVTQRALAVNPTRRTVRHVFRRQCRIVVVGVHVMIGVGGGGGVGGDEGDVGEAGPTQTRVVLIRIARQSSDEVVDGAMAQAVVEKRRDFRFR